MRSRYNHNHNHNGGWASTAFEKRHGDWVKKHFLSPDDDLEGESEGGCSPRPSRSRGRTERDSQDGGWGTRRQSERYAQDGWGSRNPMRRQSKHYAQDGWGSPTRRRRSERYTQDGWGSPTRRRSERHDQDGWGSPPRRRSERYAQDGWGARRQSTRYDQDGWGCSARAQEGSGLASGSNSTDASSLDNDRYRPMRYGFEPKQDGGHRRSSQERNKRASRPSMKVSEDRLRDLTHQLYRQKAGETSSRREAIKSFLDSYRNHA